MARISTYDKDLIVEGQDRWIGSKWNSASKETLNFSSDSVADYFNRTGKITTGAFAWTYKPYSSTEVQYDKTFELIGHTTDTVDVIGLAGTIRVSFLTLANTQPGGFIQDQWLNSTILLAKNGFPSIYGIYRCTNIVKDGFYYLIDLAFISGRSGTIQKDESCLFGVFSYGITEITATSPILATGTSIKNISVDPAYGIPTTIQLGHFDTAYNRSLVGVSVTGTTTKTLTLTEQSGATLTASWTDLGGVSSVFGRIGDVIAVSGDYNTSQVTESTNLYFTPSRARTSISLTTTGVSGAATYDSGTGILNIPNYQTGVTSFNTRTGAVTLLSTDVTGALGFTPYDASNPAGYITSAALSGYVPTSRTIATSGPLSGGGDLTANRTISISQSNSTTDGFLSSVDWGVFNAKQPALNGVGFVKISGTTISYDNSTYYLASNPAGYTSNLGTVTSVSMSMPSAFSVSGSPITTAGTLAVTAIGDTTQYIAGDGSLVSFPIAGQAGTIVRQIRNTTGATLTKGTVVYISGASGNKPTVSKAIATSDTTSAQTFGLCQTDIPNNSNGYVVSVGDLIGLDTSAFAEGAQLYLSSTTAGTYTTTKQYAPAHLVYIGVITRSHPTQGQIEVKIQNGYELDELHNVAAQTPSNNDGLFYESSTNLWKNKNIATVLGYTPEQPLSFTSPLVRTINTISIPAATSSVNGYLSSADWATFNAKQNALSGTGFVKIVGTTISYDNSSYLTTSAAASTYLPLAGGTMSGAIVGTTASFAMSGSGIALGVTGSGTGDAIKITHSSGMAFTLNSSGSGYGILINNETASTSAPFTIQKQGASVIILTDAGAGSFASSLTANSFIKTSGTSSQFLKADGSVDSSTYLTTGTAASTYVALTGNQTISGVKTFTTQLAGAQLRFSESGGFGQVAGYTQIGGTADYFNFVNGGNTKQATFNYGTGGSGYTYTLPNSNGTLALTSQLSSYLPLAGGTLTGALSGTSATFSAQLAIGTSSLDSQLVINGTTSSRINMRAGDVRYSTIYSDNGVFALSSITTIPMVFGINDIEQMRISSAGNIGIGTNSPSRKLDVVFSSSTTYTTSSLGNILTIGNTSATTNSFSGITFFATPTSGNLGVSSINNIVTGSGDSNLAFTTRGSSTISEKMRITNIGNIGIGTISPTNFQPFGYGANIEISGGRGGGFVSSDSTSAIKMVMSVDNSGGVGMLKTLTNHPLMFATNDTERMRITSGGNVGIGTTTPACLLDIQSTSATLRIKNTTAPATGGTSSILFEGINNFSGTSQSFINSIQAGNSGVTNLAFGTSGSSDATATERMRITSGGNVLIGTPPIDAGYKLDVNGTGIIRNNLRINRAVNNNYIDLDHAGTNTWHFKITTTNNSSFVISNDYLGTTNVLSLAETGAATFLSSVTASSFFESSSVAYKNILATNPVTSLNVDVIKYKRTNVDVDDVRYGYSAEQINSLMPELTNKEATAVKYLDVHTLLIAELQREIKELKAKLK